jgi:hypothetical protein
MSSRDTNLNVNVTATDRASQTVRSVASEVEQLEGTHTVDLDAAGDADDQLASIRKKLDQLTDSDKTIVLRAQADQLVREVGRAESKLKDLDKLDGDQIRVVLDARDNASKKLDAVRTELRQLDGDTATVTVDTRDRTGRAISGGELGAGATAGIAAAVAGITAGAQAAAQLSLDVQTVADLTGSSLDDASRLVGVFSASGVEASDLLDIMLNVNQVLRDNPDLAKKLGIEMGGAETVAGRTADNVERVGRKTTESTDLVSLFVQAVDGIAAAYDTAGERGAASSQLFGEEGVRQVQAVKTAINQDLAPALEQFRGPIITDESVDNAREINAQLQQTKTYVQEISVALLPIINGLLGGTVSYFKGVADAGNAVANAGGDVRRYLFGGPGQSDLDYARERAVITRNTMQGGGLTEGDYALVGLSPPSGEQRHFPGVTIYNPPGTPSATNLSQQTYLLRNGVRLS